MSPLIDPNLFNHEPLSESGAETLKRRTFLKAAAWAMTGGALTPFSAPNAFAQSDTGAASKASKKSFSLRDFDSSLNDRGDATKAMTKALHEMGPGGRLTLPPGAIYFLSESQTFQFDDFQLECPDGQATLRATPGSQYEALLTATGRSNIVLRNIVIDANQRQRAAGQTTRFMGLNFHSCKSPRLIKVVAMNTLGFNHISGVGLSLGGKTLDGRVEHCEVVDCGAGAQPSDGIYTSGDNNVILSCRATRCTDTAFVVASSNHSGIVDCFAQSCSCAGAITNATNATASENYIDGLVGNDWNAGVTGGVQIGNPLSTTTGDLVSTKIAGLTLTRVAGNGPAINVRRTGRAVTRGLEMNDVVVDGAARQGILINATDVTLTNPQVRNTKDACIQFQSGSSNCRVIGAKLNGGSFGIVATSVSSIEIEDLSYDGNGAARHAVYFFGRAKNIRVRKVSAKNILATPVSSDTGTIPTVVNE